MSDDTPTSDPTDELRNTLVALRDEMAKVIVGQDGLVTGLLTAALANGHVLLEGVPVVGVEAGVSLGWDRYADVTVTIDRFGASAPGDVAMEQLGFTATAVERAARSLII